jgi:hypothetical protein
MDYTVACDCGRSLVVRAGDAGTQRVCLCGATVSIPALSILQQPTQSNSHTEGQLDSAAEERSLATRNPTLVIGITLIVVSVVGAESPPLLMPLGVLMVAAGRLWLAMLVLREMAFPNALMVFFVPLMPTVFLFKRFDVAWRPFLFGISGFVAFQFGWAATPL